MMDPSSSLIDSKQNIHQVGFQIGFHGFHQQRKWNLLSVLIQAAVKSFRPPSINVTGAPCLRRGPSNTTQTREGVIIFRTKFLQELLIF